MTRKWFVGLAVVLLAQPAMAQNGTRNGAVLGGVGGAVIGGIIGHQNRETPEGALIGGAVGAVAGGLIGNARDDKLARERYQQQQYQQQQQWNQQRYNQTNFNTYRSTPSRPTVVQSGVTIADVLSMTRSGIGESVIINHVYATGIQRRIDTQEIIMLHQQGVSENVINAMQQAPLRTSNYPSGNLSGPSATTIMAPPGGTVIVQEQYGVPTYAAPYSAPYSGQTYAQPTYSQHNHVHTSNSRPTYTQPNYARPVRRGF